MKRTKAKPEVKLDISENFQPLTEGFKRASVSSLKAHQGDIDQIVMNGVLEQRNGAERIEFMRALHKALKPGGKAMCTVSHWATAGASMSPFTQWPPLSPESFGFFSADVRARSDYKNPKLNDIDFDLQWAEIYPPEWQTKADAVRVFAAKHYIGVIQGLVVTLTKKEKD